VVAAAGNDTVNNQHYFTSSGPANTRYPAAFGSVLGVAALDRHNTPATYSNAADAPQHDGVATFGGAATEHAALAEHGMLGVYTADTFPDQSENTNGWAWWAGTSFAAPVVTGTLAALLSDDPDPEAALATVKSIAQQAGTTTVGPVFPVQQG
jgi:subtilisin family serine protease